MTRFSISALLSLLLTVTAVDAQAATADDAYKDAKGEYQKLKADQKRRKLRHHWLNVAKKFSVIAQKYPKSDRAPEALFLGAELFSDLSRFSQNDEDLTAAVHGYQKLVNGWPKHALADDAALLWARILTDRQDDVSQARTVLKGALPNAKDKKKDITALLASLPAEKAKPVAKAEPKAAEKTAPKNAVAKAAESASVRPVIVPAAKTAAKSTFKKPAVAVAKLDEDTAEEEVEAPKLVGPKARTSTEDSVDEGAVEPSADAEGSLDDRKLPMISALQEKLRDVRVGERTPEVSNAEAKARVKVLKKSQDEVSLAQQLGLKFKRVIIDAGHGGHDTGAIGPKGVLEKDASLAMATKLSEKLTAMGLDVVMTRDDDTFVKLEDRTRIANKEHGDLFISVHCNAAVSKKMRGIETYTLNTSADRYSIRLAARENASTERGVGDLQYILADLATKANTGESSQLAQRVQQSLVSNLSKEYTGIRDLGTKEALFFVLLGAKMPAILVETSFISNPEDEQRLNDDKYQEKVADSIASAVNSFLEARNKVAQID